MHFKPLAGVVMVWALAACTASRVQVRPEQLTAFHQGQSTPQDVIAMLGNPTSQTVTSDGSRMLFYSYAAAQARPGSFIPIVGPLVGGADVQTSMVWFRFGPDGKMIDYSASNSATGTATGFAAPATPTTPNQPAAAQ